MYRRRECFSTSSNGTTSPLLAGGLSGVQVPSGGGGRQCVRREVEL